MAFGHAHALYCHGDSYLHRAAPQVKIAAAFGIVIGIVATPRQAFWAFGAYALVLIGGMARARLPASFVLRRMSVEIPFLVVAALLPLFGAGDRVQALGLSLSAAGLWDAWNIVAKASLGLMTAILLAATTQIPDMLRGLEALRVPPVVTAIAGFMVRYVDVILEQFSRMRVAMVSRGHDPSWVSQIGAYGATLGSMFVRTYERGERVSLAMASRGYDGSMPATSVISASAGQWLRGAGIVALAWTIAGLARVTQ